MSNFLTVSHWIAFRVSLLNAIVADVVPVGDTIRLMVGSSLRLCDFSPLSALVEVVGPGSSGPMPSSFFALSDTAASASPACTARRRSSMSCTCSSRKPSVYSSAIAWLADEEASPATDSFSGMGGSFGRCFRDALLLFVDSFLHFGGGSPSLLPSQSLASESPLSLSADGVLLMQLDTPSPSLATTSLRPDWCRSHASHPLRSLAGESDRRSWS